MNNRLAIQDLAGLLAEYTGKDKNSSERFLREFIAVVAEGVYTDKLVRSKGSVLLRSFRWRSVKAFM